MKNGKANNILIFAEIAIEQKSPAYINLYFSKKYKAAIRKNTGTISLNPNKCTAMIIIGDSQYTDNRKLCLSGISLVNINNRRKSSTINVTPYPYSADRLNISARNTNGRNVIYIAYP